jgi:hypothetical protein
LRGPCEEFFFSKSTAVNFSAFNLAYLLKNDRNTSPPPPEKNVTYDDVELCVNVDQLSVVVDDRQGRDPLVHKLPESLDDGHGVLADLAKML